MWGGVLFRLSQVQEKTQQTGEPRSTGKDEKGQRESKLYLTVINMFLTNTQNMSNSVCGSVHATSPVIPWKVNRH